MAVASRPGPIQPGLSVVHAADEVDKAYAHGDVREEVERQATAERHGGDRGQRLAELLDRLLEAECEQDDPGDHRQVQVAVEVARKPSAGRAARLRQLALRQDGDDVEVRPPEGRDDDDAEDRRPRRLPG